MKPCKTLQNDVSLITSRSFCGRMFSLFSLESKCKIIFSLSALWRSKHLWSSTSFSILCGCGSKPSTPGEHPALKKTSNKTRVGGVVIISPPKKKVPHGLTKMRLLLWSWALHGWRLWMSSWRKDTKGSNLRWHGCFCSWYGDVHGGFHKILWYFFAIPYWFSFAMAFSCLLRPSWDSSRLPCGQGRPGS